MRPVRPGRDPAAVRPRRDPAPSRLEYRLNRLWLRPWFRRGMNFGLPVLAGLLAAWTLAAEFDLRARAAEAADGLRALVVDQPRFTIDRIEVPGVSADLAEQIRVAAFVPLPVSSLEVQVGAVRERIEALDAVERARVRALPSGVLEIRAVERLPVVVWRSAAGLELLDRSGVRVAEIDSRLRRSDLPLIAGAGAGAEVPEAQRLFDLAAPLAPRIRGLVRIGERRWDLVLDRDQVIRLPERGAESALAGVLALDAEQALLARDLTAVDVRDPRRPMLRMTARAAEALGREHEETPEGEDA